MTTANPALLTTLKSALSLFDTPDPLRVLVADISHWTGPVDFSIAKEKLAGIIIKFTDGTTKTKWAEENYKAAKDAGMLVGGYHWLYRSTNVSTGRQARFYLDFLKDHPCDIRPTVDFEWTNYKGAASNPNISDLYGFVTPFEDGYGQKPMIYTAPGYWNDSKYGSKDIKWADYPLWKAQYRMTKTDPIVPWNDSYKFWQFTANGKGTDYGCDPAYSKSIDLNYWIGTLDELKLWCGVLPPVEPPAPPPVDEKAIRTDEVNRVIALMEARKDALK